jgi:hypothetical protein
MGAPLPLQFYVPEISLILSYYM